MVMGNLLKKLFRDIRQYKGQFIAITLVIFVGAFFYTGFSNFVRNFDDHTNHYFIGSNLADLWLHYSETSNEEVTMLEALDGVQTVEGRIVFTANQDIDNIKATLKVHSLTENINKTTMVDGVIPTEYMGIAVDSDYAREHGIQIGDTVVISVNDKLYSLTVTGLCENAEYVIKSRDSSDYPPNHREYGIAYLSEETIINGFGITAYNEILVNTNGTVSFEDIENSAESISEACSSGYLYALRREANLGYKQLADEIAQQKLIAKFLPVAFFAVAALITFLTMSRMVDAQRTQIGIMKALGAGRRKIIAHYMSYAVIVGLIGGLTGSAAGAYLLPGLFIEQLNTIASLPGFAVNIHYSYIIQSLALSIIFGALACLISVRKILKENASQAMRIKPPKSVKRTLIEKLPLWGRLKYSDKLIFRNIFTNKRRTIYSAVGIICCVAFLILGFGYRGSRAELVEKQYTEVFNYDLRVVFKEPVQTENLPSFIGAKYVSETAQTDVVVTNLADKRTINLIALASGDKNINNYDKSGNLLVLNDTTVIISDRYADTYNLSVGDTLTLKLIEPEYRGVSFDATIGGISVQYLNQDIYCTFGLLDSNGIALEADTVLYQLDDSVSEQDIYSAYTGMDTVKEVKTISDLRAITESGLENMFVMIIVIIICSILLCAAAIYNISIINIQERFRELATLKVLGCQLRRINDLIFKENIIVTVFAVIIGVPAGIALYLTAVKAFTLDSMVFPVYVTADSILWPVAITLMVTVLSNLLLRRKVKRIDMIESLKANE